MKPRQNPKSKIQNCLVFGIVDSSLAAGGLILYFAFSIEVARRNG